MLTKLGPDIKFLFDCIENLTILPVSIPYKFQRPDHSSNRGFISYKFYVNQWHHKNGWRFQVTLLALNITLTLLNAAHNPQKSLFDFGLYYMYIVANICIIILAIYNPYVANDIAGFMNHFTEFESTNSLELNNVVSSSCWISLVIRVFSTCIIPQSLVFSLAATVYPHAPWSYQAYLYRYLCSISEKWNISVTLRAFVFIYHYITQKNILNFSIVFILVNVLVSNYFLFILTTQLNR